MRSSQCRHQLEAAQRLLLSTVFRLPQPLLRSHPSTSATLSSIPFGGQGLRSYQKRARSKNTYCSWQPGDFSQFSDIDRQTELTDLDGSLTGLLSGTASGNEPTISVNNDPISDPTSAVYDPTVSSNFFNAPVITPECATNVPASPNVPMPTATVNTSPYEYVTTAVFPDCGGTTGSCTAIWGTSLHRSKLLWSASLPSIPDWSGDDGVEFRPHQVSEYSHACAQATGQRSNLTMNHGSYYIDTTVPPATQLSSNTGPDTKPIVSTNVFARRSCLLHLRAVREAFTPPDLQHVHRHGAFVSRR